MRDRGIHILDMRAPMRGRHMVLAARFGPTHRPAEMSRGEGDQYLFHVEVHLCTEPTADIRRQDADPVLGPAQGLRQPAPGHMGHLAWQHKRETLVERVIAGAKGSRLEGAGNQSLIDQADGNHTIRCLGGSVIIAPFEAKNANQVARYVVMELWGAIAQRGFGVHDNR